MNEGGEGDGQCREEREDGGSCEDERSAKILRRWLWMREWEKMEMWAVRP